MPNSQVSTDDQRASNESQRRCTTRNTSCAASSRITSGTPSRRQADRIAGRDAPAKVRLPERGGPPGGGLVGKSDAVAGAVEADERRARADPGRQEVFVPGPRAPGGGRVREIELAARRGFGGA